MEQEQKHSKNIVMIHGLATNLAFWYPSATHLSKNYRITLFDLPGHGKSSTPENGYTPYAIAEGLIELLDHLNIQSFYLIGHSFGGSIAMQFANLFPERLLGLVLADARIKCLQPDQKPKDWIHWEKLKSKLEEMGIVLNENQAEGGYQLLTELARWQVRTESGRQIKTNTLADSVPVIGNKRTAKRWLTILETTSILDDLVRSDRLCVKELQQINIPILGVYGELSPTLVSGQLLNRLCENFRFERIADSGHFFPLSKPKRFVHFVEEFLQG